MTETAFTSYAQRVLAYGISQPDELACVFQPRGPETAVTMTYAQLRSQVLERAGLLADRGLVGERVALIYATGLEFVVDFLACLQAGAIAVPLNLSRNSQQLSRTLSVLKDADVRAILTLKESREHVGDALAKLAFDTGGYLWLNEDESGVMNPGSRNPLADDVAFIQYTSGSTSRPKGVVVSQGNVVDNQEAIKQACRHELGLVAGGWLPQFHDMGLIGHMLQPLYLGGSYVFMPPMNFIQRPRRWLELISRYRIASSAAPNFGYEHCVKFIAPREDLSGLDLSCWKVALNGSEPVNASTMADFAARFVPYGFSEDAFFPCYGMAETTLFVSGGPVGHGVVRHTVDESAFEKGRVVAAGEGKTVVSCGIVSSGFDVRIVDPDTRLECDENTIGEIWLSGASVAKGYWCNPEATAGAFRAHIVGQPGKYWLRTGDMGYVCDSQLYVTGRIKEMMIIRGRNIYPYDIERTCSQTRFASGTAAVFTLDTATGPCLAALVEVKKSILNTGNLMEMEFDIKGMVMDQHDIALDRIQLVKPGTIPKTTSGKIQRTKCGQLFSQLTVETPEGA